MLEELLINIRSIYEGGGFTSLNASLVESQAAMSAMEAQSAATMVGMGNNTSKGMTLAEQNMAKANLALNQFQLEAVAAESAVVGGLTPAMRGMDISRLSQMGVDMEVANAKMAAAVPQVGRVEGAVNKLGLTMTQVGQGLLVGAGAIVAAEGVIAYMGVKSAEQSEQNWGRLTVALGRSGTEMEAVKAEYSSMIDSIQSDTARTRGDIISAIGNLSRVGVVNKQIQQSSVEAMSALAMIKYPGDPAGFNTVSEAWTNMINKPTLLVKTLATAGVDTNKFNDVLKQNNLTMKDWANLTTEQRSNLLTQTVALQNGAAANEAYKHSYQGIMAQLSNLWSQFITGVGYEIIPILKDFGTAAFPILAGILHGFQALPGPIKDILLVAPLAVAAVMAFGGVYILLKNAKDGISGITDALNILNKTPCAPKECITTSKTVCGGTTGTPGSPTNPTKKFSLQDAAAVAIPGAYAVADAYNAMDFGSDLFGRTGDMGRSIAGGVSAFGKGLPLPLLMSTISTGKFGGGSWVDQEKTEFSNYGKLGSGLSWIGGGISGFGSALKDSPLSGALAPLNVIKGLQSNWGDISGGFSGLKIPSLAGARDWLTGNAFKTPDFLQGGGLGGLLGGLLPKPASAAGTGGNKSIGNDIFGKNGMLDMSRFKFPTVTDIINMLKSKIPMLNWKIPTVQQIIQRIATFIHDLIWKIPSIPNIIQKIGDYITQLLWSIPGAADVLNRVAQFIDWLHWSIPSPGEILDAIVNRMTGGARGGDNANASGGDMLNSTTKGITKSITNTASKHEHNYNITIGKVADKETADHLMGWVKQLNQENIINGRSA